MSGWSWAEATEPNQRRRAEARRPLGDKEHRRVGPPLLPGADRRGVALGRVPGGPEAATRRLEAGSGGRIWLGGSVEASGAWMWPT
jgi:hypothetical protein